MTIEEEVFQKSIILYDKLVPYGFQKREENYIITKKIKNNSFEMVVEISSSGKVSSKIYDLSFQEEYTNHRIEHQTGKFVNQIREELLHFLKNIKENCTKETFFRTNQANRITDWITKQYHDVPEFMWEKFPGYGIFRNPRNEKWYGAIMNINKSKLDEEEEEVEILNVKLEEQKVEELLKRKGFYQAYHMNKKNWITILLDDTIKDKEIISYIEKSHDLTNQKTEWIIPANPKYYDMINCFSNTDTITWKQSNNINIGDIIYIYLGKPYSAVLYQCEVVEINIPYEYKDRNLSMSKVMKIKLLRKFDQNQFPFEKLKEYGIKAIRGPRSITKEFSNAIKKQ